MNKPVAIGEVLLGKYRVERVLGQGGMGLVVAVRHVDLGQLQAMKFLVPAAIGHEEAVERFLREAKAAARLSSEHVAKVQDVGRTENGALYMLMEYLEGYDLKALLSRQGPFSVEDAVMYMLHVCDAIGEAHAAGIVHRDLKPANLFVVRRRNGSACVKVLDFGISKQMDPQGVDLTDTNAALGSPLYMSPEQMGQSKTVDARTDIWALGVILYELLAGTSPFRGASIFEVTSRVLLEEPTPLRELSKDVPQDLEVIIAKCMRKCRDERFQSVDELQTELSRFVPSEMIARPPEWLATNQPVVITNDVTSGESTTTTFGRTGKQLVPSKQRSPLSMGMIAGLVLVIGGAFVSRCVMNDPMGVQPAASAVSAPSASTSAQPLPKAPRPPSTSPQEGTTNEDPSPDPEKPKPPPKPPPKPTKALPPGPAVTSKATATNQGRTTDSPF